MNARSMRGVYVVEFAIIGLLLFILLFAILEFGRLYFTVNALNETVRRGARLAAVCDISDPVILRRAIYNAATDAGASSLIGDLETADLTLAYLDESGATVASPNNLVSPDGFIAIRYVQLRVENFSFNLMIPVLGGTITLPVFRSTLPRESLGRHAEEDVLPEITPC
ncbi:pilus assembly protein [Pseudomonas sp. BN417]|uniref:TadE/TadG family type IV pilus assembly protein n=1 Tax=Pseudomonas sp. BN417 TaxID=2567890 RepID=UPI0024544040|nr:TadE/TadG family type IV pilus assembly protein [Pseudomonas sp. BN417]MDH4554923.1 pilus assembly protein [Pseudomonas sp. BN417]